MRELADFAVYFATRQDGRAFCGDGYDRLAALSDSEKGGNIRENVIETVQMVTGTAAENTATIGIETTATSLGHAAAGVVLAVFVDIAVAQKFARIEDVSQNSSTKGKCGIVSFKQVVNLLRVRQEPSLDRL